MDCLISSSLVFRNIVKSLICEEQPVGCAFLKKCIVSFGLFCKRFGRLDANYSNHFHPFPSVIIIVSHTECDIDINQGGTLEIDLHRLSQFLWVKSNLSLLLLMNSPVMGLAVEEFSLRICSSSVRNPHYWFDWF